MGRYNILMDGNTYFCSDVSSFSIDLYIQHKLNQRLNLYTKHYSFAKKLDKQIN